MYFFFSRGWPGPSVLFWEWQLAHALLTTCVCLGIEELLLLGCVVSELNTGDVVEWGSFVSGA